jgi:hypothetical protein
MSTDHMTPRQRRVPPGWDPIDWAIFCVNRRERMAERIVERYLAEQRRLVKPELVLEG